MNDKITTIIWLISLVAMFGVAYNIGYNQHTPDLLSANQTEWSQCRHIAWADCGMFGVETEHAFVNMYEEGRITYHEYRLFRNLSEMTNVCWMARADICDSQFDMNIIETADLIVTVNN